MNIFTYSDSYFINPFFLSIYIYRFFFYDGVVTVLDEQVDRFRVKFIDNTLKIKRLLLSFSFITLFYTDIIDLDPGTKKNRDKLANKSIKIIKIIFFLKEMTYFV